MALRSGWGQQYGPPAGGAFSSATTVASTQIGGLSSRQVVFGSSVGGIAQSAFFQVDSTLERVGIGTTAPTGVFQVMNRGTTDPILTVSTASDVVVGGGTLTSPLLHVQNYGDVAQASLRLTGSLNAPVWTFVAYGSNQGTTANNRKLALIQGSTDLRMAIDSSGFVGIGTITPAGPLQVNSGTTAILTVTTANRVGIGTTAPLTRLHIQDGGLEFSGTAGFGGPGSGISASSAVLNLVTLGTIRLTINSSGHLGIGTTAPSGPLQVNSGTTAVLAVTTNNGVGIGTTAPNAGLDVAANARIGAGANNSLGFYGSPGSTQPSTYTTGSATTSRTFPSTFTTGGSTNTITQLNNLIRVTQQLYADLRGMNMLR